MLGTLKPSQPKKRYRKTDPYAEDSYLLQLKFEGFREPTKTLVGHPDLMIAGNFWAAAEYLQRMRGRLRNSLSYSEIPDFVPEVENIAEVFNKIAETARDKHGVDVIITREKGVFESRHSATEWVSPLSRKKLPVKRFGYRFIITRQPDIMAL